MKESTNEKPNPWTSTAPPAVASTRSSISGRLSEQNAESIDKRPVSQPPVIDVDTPQAEPTESANASRFLADEEELHAIIGTGTTFEGSLSFSGRVRIDGDFSGQILGGQLLVVGDGARVRGEIQARQVIVLGGTVEANITASNSIELYLPAQVTGDLRSPQIYMDKGIRFQGTCDMTWAE